jgi:uncharacterized protein
MALSPSSLPFLGAGLGYRRSIAPFFERHRAQLAFVEVMPEHLLDANPAQRRDFLSSTRGFPVVTHSVSLSVGTATGPDQAHLEAVAKINRRYRAPWTSDHLCFTKTGTQEIGQLTPIPYTDETLAIVCRNVQAIQRAIGIPFLLENISRYFAFQASTMDEAEFLTEVTRRTGCGLLLDVTNLRNNHHNLGTNVETYLEALPLERLVQFHLAGAEWIDGKLLDTHGAPIHDDVWAITKTLAETTDVRALLIERDQTFGSLKRLAAELAKANRIMSTARGA